MMSTERHRLHPAVIVVFALAAVMVLTVVLGLWHVRRDTLFAQSRLLSSLATASADDLQRGLQGVTRGMQALRDDLHEARLRPGAAGMNEQLQRQLATLALVRKLWVVDLDGNVLAASSPAANPGLPGFGAAAAALGDEQVALSTPFVDPQSHDTVVALALRFALADGPAGGWVMAEIPADVLLGSFPRATPAPDARMAVLRGDGALLAGTLVQRLPPATSGHEPTPLQQSSEELQAFSDGTWRLVEQRRIDPLGLRLVVTRDVEAGLARWYDALRIAVLGTAAVLAVLAAMLWRMLRAERARFRVQRVLQAERDRASLAFAAAKEGNWDWDNATEQFYASPRMKALMGLPRASRPEAHTFAELAVHLHPEDVPLLERMLRQQAAAPGQPPLDVIVRTRHVDERWHSVRLRGTPALDEAGRATRLAGVASDVTEELARAEHTRRLEVRLARAQRLESLGTLAGTVAHDFNNILAAVLGYTEMARQAASQGSAQARHLDQVLQAAQRGRGVIDRILTFSRGGARRHEVFAVQPVVEQVLGLLGATIDSSITVERDLERPDLCVRGDATALFEAVMNLCTNAVQALQDRPDAHGAGWLGVGLQEVQFCQEHWTSHGWLAPGAYARLTIRDNGAGMDAEALEHLFEPFFTTRGARGTGLGLAVVHGVADVFGGGVDVHSVVGEGSTFTLYLPQAPSGGAPAEPSAPAGCSEAPQGQGQAVLLVDDEPALVALAEELLASLGYEPVGVTDPARALAEVQADPQRFDLVITDEVMPGLQGTELARRVRELSPGLPVLLVSGYGGPQLAQRARDVGIARVLAKPLHIDELARAVADVVAARLDTSPSEGG